jgi:hypothetical protein
MKRLHKRQTMLAFSAMLELSSTLREWGVTIGLLSVAATTLVVLLVLSLREFMYWYLRLSHISKQQEELHRKLDVIEHMLKGKAVSVSPPAPVAAVQKETSVAQFPLVKAADQISLDA